MSFTPTVVSLLTSREVRCETLLSVEYEAGVDTPVCPAAYEELYSEANIKLIAAAMEDACDLCENPALLEVVSFDPENPLKRKVSLHVFNYRRLGNEFEDTTRYQMMRHSHRWTLDGSIQHSGNDQGRMYREMGTVVHFIVGNSRGVDVASIHSTLRQEVITRIYKTWIGEDF